MKIQRALLSVSDKSGLVPFAQALAAAGVELISTGGTARTLREAGLTVKDISEHTGFPEILDGRVKTLHPKVHGGLLFIRGNDAHEATVKEHEILPIDLVVVNLYPFEQTVARPSASLHDAVENIDIGGPSMLRSAAKNHESVTVVVDPADYNQVAEQIRANGETTLELRRNLAAKVFARTAAYDGAIDQYLAAQTGKTIEHLTLKDGRKLAYAENRCQNPAWLFAGEDDNPLAMSKFQVAAGDPGYIAMADGARLVDIARLLTHSFWHSFCANPYIAITGKHGNPCGVAIDWTDPATATIKALKGDPTAVMGGELVTNFPITDELGQLIHCAKEAEIGREFWGLDQVMAPEISPGIIKLLGKKAKRRLLVNPLLANSLDMRVREDWTYQQLPDGDWLRRRLSPFVLLPETIQSWTGKALTGDDLANLLIAFACAWRATSNSVALAKDLGLIGLGCGQQDRIACVRLALDRANRAGHSAIGSVFASDAFFPYASVAEKNINLKPVIGYDLKKLFEATVNDERARLRGLSIFAELIGKYDRREGPELLRDAGCIGGVVPADGKNLAEVQEFFRQANMSVAFVSPENRGFARH